MRIHGITTSVNYTDLLSRGLDRWALGCEKLVVVTAPDDKACQDLCRFHNVECYVTDVFTDNGARFNKGAALSEAIIATDWRKDAEWLLHFDADIVPPQDWRQQVEAYAPKPGSLYGATRYWIPVDQQELVVDPKRKMPQAWVIGFFSMFHAQDPRLPRDPMFPIHYGHAGWYDTDFSRNWDRETQHKFLPLDLIHVGEERRNWMGRDDSSRADLEKLLNGDRSKDCVRPPKLNPHRPQPAFSTAAADEFVLGLA